MSSKMSQTSSPHIHMISERTQTSPCCKDPVMLVDRCVDCGKRHEPGRCCRKNQPRWLNGDLVRREPVTALSAKYGSNVSMVIGVMKANPGDNHLTHVYPYVYYIFTPSSEAFEGPLFQSQLTDV